MARMEIAKVFTNGGSQAVRLPKSCRFNQDEVFVNRIGNIVMLIPKDDPWESMLQGFNMFSEDFLKEGVEGLPVQERASL